MASKSYTMAADCSNCGRLQFISIPRGVPVRQFDISAKPCPNCGVSSLKLVQM